MLLAFFAALLVLVSVFGTILVLRMDDFHVGMTMKFKDKGPDLRIKEQNSPTEKEKLPEAEEQRYLR
jgi:hypothetical protein